MEMTAFDRAWDLLLKDFVIAPTLSSEKHPNTKIRGFTDQQVKPIYQVGASSNMQGSTTPYLDAALEDKNLPNEWNNFGPEGFYQKGGSRVRQIRIPSSQYTEDYVVANLPAHLPQGISWSFGTGEIHQPEFEDKMTRELAQTLLHEWGHQATALPMIRDDGNNDVVAHEIAAHILENPGGWEEHERAKKNVLEQEPTAKMPQPFIHGGKV